MAECGFNTLPSSCLTLPPCLFLRLVRATDPFVFWVLEVLRDQHKYRRTRRSSCAQCAATSRVRRRNILYQDVGVLSYPIKSEHSRQQTQYYLKIFNMCRKIQHDMLMIYLRKISGTFLLRQDRARLEMDNLVYFEAGGCLPGGSLFVEGDLSLRQTWPLSVYGGT